MLKANSWVRCTGTTKIVLFLITLCLLTIFKTQSASAANFTWNGDGGDADFSTAANWVGDTAPTGASTDSLIFDNTLANFDTKTPNNDLTDATFNTLTFQGSESDVIDIEGNGLSVDGGIVTNAANRLDLDITLTDDQSFSGDKFFQHVSGTLDLGTYDLTIDNSYYSYFYSSIAGSGNITLGNNTYAAFLVANTYTGLTTLGTYSFLYIYNATSLGAASSGTILPTDSALYISIDSGGTITEPFELSGKSTATTNPTIFVKNNLPSSDLLGRNGSGKTINLTGAINLNSDVSVKLFDYDDKLIVTNVTKNGHKLFHAKGSAGTLKVNGTTAAPGGVYVLSSVVTADYTTSYTRVYANTDYTYTGRRGDVYVEGIFRGTSRTADLYVYNTGTVSPGQSPGCITSDDVTVSGGTYNIQIGGTTECTDYDQQRVNGTLTISSGSTLNVSTLNNFVPTGGDQFIIFNNDGSDAVSGHFDGLEEGATLSLGGVDSQISYTGGDGNDIVITAIPGVPDSGGIKLKINILYFVVPGFVALLASRSTVLKLLKRK